MAGGKPSMMALLGLLAVAGYKHKDKISDMLAGAGAEAGGGQGDAGQRDSNPAAAGSQSGSLLTELAAMFGGNAAGGTLANGLGELVERFKAAGRTEEADSWIAQGSNRELKQDSLEQTLGDDTLAELSDKTGLSRLELLARLATNIPDAVDRYSPDGRLPTEQEAEQYR